MYQNPELSNLVTSPLHGYTPRGSDIVNMADQYAASRPAINPANGSATQTAAVLRTKNALIPSVDTTVNMTQLGSALEGSRTYFRGLSATQSALLDQLLPPIVPAHLHPTETKIPWARHLAAADNDTTVAFWRWNNQFVCDRNNDPTVRSTLEEQDMLYANYVRTAVDNHDLPASALNQLPKVATTPVVIGDVFDVDLRGGVAYYSSVLGRIIIGHRATLHDLYHEKTHVTGSFPYKPLDEAVVEDMTHGLTSGNFDTVDPTDRIPAGTYKNKRYLRYSVMVSGIAPIENRLFFEAHFDPTPHGSAMQKLAEQAKAAFPAVDIWRYVTDTLTDQSLDLAHHFPQADHNQVLDISDWYAASAVYGLGALARGEPATDILKSLEETAEAVLEEDTRLKHLDLLPGPAKLENSSMLRHASRRIVENFRAGAAFPH